MQKITVSRTDDLYEAFADIAKAADGTLVCTYRESMCHSQQPFSRIVVRRSVEPDNSVVEVVAPSGKITEVRLKEGIGGRSKATVSG